MAMYGDDLCECRHHRNDHGGLYDVFKGVETTACRGHGCSCQEFVKQGEQAPAPEDPSVVLVKDAATQASDLMFTAARDYIDKRIDLSEEQKLQAIMLAILAMREASIQGWNAHMGAKQLRQSVNRFNPN